MGCILGVKKTILYIYRNNMKYGLIFVSRYGFTESDIIISSTNHNIIEMKKTLTTILIILTLGISTVLSQNTAPTAIPGDFKAGEKTFLLNGKPFILRAGELHYSRIPKPYWEHRIQLAKAMGMNTICIYLFWNYHEQQQAVYDFTGDKDIAEFVRLIQKNGMYCILRPGPYVCAEWDMGGLPWWLLKKKDIKVRTINDELYMSQTKKFFVEVGKQLALYQIQNGGPIIMVQVENEYSAWGSDEKYMSAIRDYLREVGFDKTQLIRCDWSSNFDRYKLDGVATAMNFGAGSNIDNQFKRFGELYPNAPQICGEYWTGWFDKWGSPHETRDVKSFIGSLKDMMDRNISFSLYMAHGGTSFGQWAGANAPAYAPTTSSYDYNSPIDEAGNPTDKFYAIRDLLKNYLQAGETLADIPQNPETTITIPEINFTQTANLFENLPTPTASKEVKPMEFFNQGWGSILYRKQLAACNHTKKLVIKEVHDWAVIFINGIRIGTLDRRRSENLIEIPVLNTTATLDILVEGMGRVNFGEAIIDRKGITDKVLMVNENTETELTDWSVFNFPVDYKFQKRARFKTKIATGPAWYKATFELKKTGYTYLDMSSWGKGMVWVNGHNLGRFWKIGPTQTLCVPGCFLKKGRNEVIVLDIDKPAKTSIVGLDHPILDKIVQEKTIEKKSYKKLILSENKPVVSGTLNEESGWKTIKMDKMMTGKYFCFEALSAVDKDDNSSSIAEFEILGENGKSISSINWKVVWVDSEETTKVSNGADKLFDIQESIIWQTRIGDNRKHPHQIVIDMGKVINVSGFRILPRSDNSKKGIVKDFNFYLEKRAFRFE